MKGVIATEAGYSGGATRNRTHEQVCSHITGHAEVAKVEFERSVVSCAKLLDLFFRDSKRQERCHELAALSPRK